MVLVDVDEYIWPEYDPRAPSSSSSSSTTSRTRGDTSTNPDEEADGFYQDEGRRLHGGEATLLPSHVPRFSRRTKLLGTAAGLVVLLITLAVGLSQLQQDSPHSSAATPSNDTHGSSTAFNATGSELPESNASASLVPPSSGSGGPDIDDDDPCPIELSAARACFVDDPSALSGSFHSASVAQSVCESCLVGLWPRTTATMNRTATYDPSCGLLDNATICQEMLTCECGSCSVTVVAYLLCATATKATESSPSCHQSDDTWASSIPAPCQQLLSADPSPSTLDLFPPEATLWGDPENNASSTSTTSPTAPTPVPVSSPMPTPVPRCLNESRAFDNCVDPEEGDGASCLLCLLSHWPSGAANSSNGSSTTAESMECDDALVNATCVGLEVCDNHCHGCQDEYVGFLTCQVETCRDEASASAAERFNCP